MAAKIKIWISCAVVLLLYSSAAAHPFAGGSGTAAAPYQISTPQQLDSLHNYVGSATYANTHFALINDIDLYDYLRPPNTVGHYGGAGRSDNKGWHPIGTAAAPFCSYFYGNGYRITGLWIHRSTDNDVGLFGYTVGANIEKLGVEVVSWEYVEGKNNVGALVGRMMNGEVKQCYSTGSRVVGQRSVGGLVGYVSGSASINETYSSISVRSVYVAGGLVGRAVGGTIQKSYAVGYMINEIADTTISDTAGGLVGYAANATIKTCFAACRNIFAAVEKGGFAGVLQYCTIQDDYCSASNYFPDGYTNASNSTGHYLKNENNNFSATGHNIGGTAVTSRTIYELATQSTYGSTFDFTNTWGICDGHSYPYFKWQRAIPPHVIAMNLATGLNLSFATLTPLDSFITYYDRSSGTSLSYWSMCDDYGCNPPYDTRRSLSIWTFDGVPDLGVYYGITTRNAASCGPQPSYPYRYLSQQRASATVDVKMALNATIGINSDTIIYGTALPAMPPLTTNPALTPPGDVMKGNWVLYRINGGITDFTNPIPYTTTLDVGQYAVGVDTFSVSVLNGGNDVGKYYTLPPRPITRGRLTVVKAAGTISINMSNYPGYDSPINGQYPTNTNNSGGGVTYYYKLCSAADNTYTTTIPAARGCYTIRAVLAATTNYTDAWDTLSFTINSMFALEVEQDNGYEGCLAPPRVVYNSLAPAAVQYTYMTSSSVVIGSTPPTTAGNYKLFAYVTDGINFETAPEVNFTIRVKEPSMLVIAQRDTIYGNPLPTTRVLVNLSGGSITYYYKPFGAPDLEYDIAQPTEAGQYTIKGVSAATCSFTATTCGSPAYSATTCAFDSAVDVRDFTIKKARGILIVVQDTGYYGYLPPPRIVEKNSPAPVTITYKVRGAPDDTYDIIIAPEVGRYTMRATMPETNNYTADSLTYDFVIVKAPGRIVFKQKEGYFNSPLPPPELISTNSGGVVSYLYKPSNMPDNYFDPSPPTNAGWYIIRGIVDSTKNYTRGISDILFEIVDTICTEQSSLVILNYWEKMMLVNLNANTNGGYTFALTQNYRWTRNAIDIGQTTLPYNYLNHYPVLGDRYMVYAITASGDSIYGCLLVGGLDAIYTSVGSVENRKDSWLYPNPIAAAQQMLVVATDDDNSLVEIYTISGVRLRQYVPVGSTTYILLDGLSAGVYIVKQGKRTAVVAVY